MFGTQPSRRVLPRVVIRRPMSMNSVFVFGHLTKVLFSSMTSSIHCPLSVFSGETHPINELLSAVSPNLLFAMTTLRVAQVEFDIA